MLFIILLKVTFSHFKMVLIVKLGFAQPAQAAVKLSCRVTVSPDQWSWWVKCYHSHQERWFKLQKQHSGCTKENFPWSKMTSLCRNVVSLKIFKLVLTRTEEPSHQHTHAHPHTHCTESQRGEVGCGLISTFRRQIRFVWTDKRGVDWDIYISPSNGWVYLK